MPVKSVTNHIGGSQLGAKFAENDAKKLSYRSVITPFKVTDFGTNRKPACNFLLVINLHSTFHRFKLLQIIGQMCAFNKGLKAQI